MLIGIVLALGRVMGVVRDSPPDQGGVWRAERGGGGKVVNG